MISAAAVLTRAWRAATLAGGSADSVCTVVRGAGVAVGSPGVVGAVLGAEVELVGGAVPAAEVVPADGAVLVVEALDGSIPRVPGLAEFVLAALGAPTSC